MDIYYQPYTYHIAWSKHNTHYYGVRYAKNCNPNDFWKSYFTSSKKVKHFIAEHGDPDIIEIRKTFDCPHEAMKWESKVLSRLNVLKNPKWLNANISGDQFIVESHSKETLAKMSINNASKRPEMRKQISERQMGPNNSFYGKKHTPESNEARRQKCKGVVWWTNGIDEVKSKEQPFGYSRGRKIRPRDSNGRFKS